MILNLLIDFLDTGDYRQVDVDFYPYVHGTGGDADDPERIEILKIHKPSSFGVNNSPDLEEKASIRLGDYIKKVIESARIEYQREVKVYESEQKRFKGQRSSFGEF